MQINGQDAKSMNFFDLSKLNGLPEELEAKPNVNVQAELRQANEIGDIPFRFASARLSDIDADFAAKVKLFCLNPRDKVFIVFGGVGTGKTTAMTAAMHERKLNGLDCGKYFSIRNLSTRLRTCRSFSARENEEAFIRDLSTVSFLCFDEVGTCLNRAEEREFLEVVLNNRYDNGLPTFIATNLSPSNFKFLIAGVDYTGETDEERKALIEHLDETHPTLNRIKSVVITHALTGKSHRLANTSYTTRG